MRALLSVANFQPAYGGPAVLVDELTGTFGKPNGAVGV